MKFFFNIIVLIVFLIEIGASQTFNYPFGKDANGTPSENFSNEAVDQDMIDFINEFLVNGQSIPEKHPELMAPNDIVNLVVKNDNTTVTVKYIQESAGYLNSLGYYTYQEGNPPTSITDITYNIIFPNVNDGSLNDNDPVALTVGDKVEIGTFDANTIIGWFLVPNGWNNNSKLVELNSLWDSTTGNSDEADYIQEWLYHSNFLLNSASTTAQQQNVLINYPDGSNKHILGFEDVELNSDTTVGGVKYNHAYDDQDFDDVVFYVTADKDLDETQSPYISIYEPSVGDRYQGGSEHTIKWTSENTDFVNIEFSDDNGDNWQTVVNSTPSDGNYQWTYPNITSTTCLIKITDPDADNGNEVSDTSVLFELYGITPEITVTSPNGGERYLVNSSHEITWNSTNVSDVTIEFSSDDGASWTNVVSSTPSDGSYTWQYPGTPSTDCLIKITDTEDGTIIDQSDSVFELYENTGPGGVKYVDLNKESGAAENGNTWQTAYTKLQDAIEAVNNNSEYNQIWVADGKYYPDEDKTAGVDSDASSDYIQDGSRITTFNIPDGVEIYGGFAGWQDGDETAIIERNLGKHTTILSGDINQTGSNNSYHVVTFENTSDATRMDGFTIQDGKANGSGDNGKGGGIFNRSWWDDGTLDNSVSSPYIINCKIRNNSNGIYNDNQSESINSPVFINCLVFNNDNPITNHGHWSSPYVTEPEYINCTILDNINNTTTAHYSVLNVDFKNCIIRANVNDSQYANTSYNYCNVQGGTMGTGNINHSPNFVDPANGNYRLQAESGVDYGLDDGDNSLFPDELFSYGVIDLVSHGRYNNTIDMGALEYYKEDIDFSDGRSFSPAIEPGKDNQVVGRFELWGDGMTSDLIATNIYLRGERPVGENQVCTNFRLYGSADNQFDIATDRQLGNAIADDPMISSGDSTLTFSRFNEAINNGVHTYFFLVCDVAAQADGSMSFFSYVKNENDLMLTAGDLGDDESEFQFTNWGAPLFHGDASLPVDLVYFRATHEQGSIKLEWQTGNEIDNRGFILDRRKNSGNWITIASYHRNHELVGAGSTSEPQDYQYIDGAVSAENRYEYRLTDVDSEGKKNVFTEKIVTVELSENSDISDRFTIQSIYPNPFNPVVNICYSLPKQAKINISIYDLNGRQIKTLRNQTQQPGIYTVDWNGRDAQHVLLSGGIYFVVLRRNDTIIQSRKIVFLK